MFFLFFFFLFLKDTFDATTRRISASNREMNIPRRLHITGGANCRLPRERVREFFKESPLLRGFSLAPLADTHVLYPATSSRKFTGVT